MKSLRVLFATLLVSLVALTGCGKKNELKPTEAIEKAAKNMQTLENYKVTVKLNLGMASGEEKVNVSLDADGIVDMKNKTMKMAMAAKAMGESVDTEMYMDFSKENFVAYAKQEDGSWVKSTADNSMASGSTESIDATFEQLDIKEVGSDKNNYNYEISLKEDTIKEILDSMKDQLENVPIDVEGLIKDITIKYSIDKETGNYSKFSIDLESMLKKVIDEVIKQSGQDVDIKIDAANFEITISDYNKAGSVEIPSEVIENAVSELGSEDDPTTEINVKTCTLTSNEDGYEGLETVTIGLDDNNIVESIDSEVVLKFDDEEAAQLFYDEVSDSEEYDGVFKFNNSITLTSSEEITDDVNYETTKKEFEDLGYTCE